MLTDTGLYTTTLASLTAAGFKQSAATNYTSGPTVLATAGTSYCAYAVSCEWSDVGLQQCHWPHKGGLLIAEA